MKRKRLVACALAGIAVVGASGWLVSQARADSVEVVQLETFQMPEVVPNEVLDETEVVAGSVGVLVRSEDSLHVVISTKDLPSGAYTFWWHLLHPDGEVSILWAGYALVGDCPDDSDSDSDSNSDSDDAGCDTGGDSEVILNSNLPEGEENAPGDIFIGHGLQPGTALVVDAELWVRYHGLLSTSDAERAEEQLTKPFGGCTDERNPNPKPEDYPCWNPQRAVF